MTAALSGFLPSLTWIVIVLGYGCALWDWGRATPRELRPALRPAAAWATGGIALVVVLVAVLLAGAGGKVAREYLTRGPGMAQILQAAGLIWVVPIGALWAERQGTKALRGVRRRWRAWPWRWLAVSLAAMLAWTAVLMLAGRPHATGLPAELGVGKLPGVLQWPFVLGLLTLAPILEECLFRHYLLHRIGWGLRGARWGRGAAVVVVSGLWAAGHHGLLEPEWLKFAQVFVVGLMLGATALRHGLEAAIALHWAYNLSVLAILLLRVAG